MLTSLHIENIAVIRRADVELDRGFSALTGETGAGKSMIIDSINLLLGNRLSREMIRSGEKSATVSAVFEFLSQETVDRLSQLGFSVQDNSLMLQRTVNREGRSQTRLDGQIITQAVQREIAGMLVSIHGQSDNQKLLQKSSHRSLLDTYAQTQELLEEYRSVYKTLKEREKKLAEYSRDESEKMRLAEILKYQIEDIRSANLKEGEEEALTQERDCLANLEQINRQAHLSYRALRGSEKGSAYDLCRRAQAGVSSLAAMLPQAAPLVERLETVLCEIDDIAESALAYADEEIADPTEHIDRLEGRLELISKLKRKYGTSIREVLEFCRTAEERLDDLTFSEEHRSALEKEIKTLTSRAEQTAEKLTLVRKRAATEIKSQVTETLAFLDMPKVRFDIGIAPCPLSESGADDIEFLIATNPGEPLLPMIRIASGGELSRIMLALRSVLNDREGADTVIFDEIDTGVSGKTARKVGIKLSEIARNTQVLCVTHSAQIASLADSHYRISKSEREGRAETHVQLLNKEERVEEIARILGGINVTDAQRQAATEMIEEYR
ncbi:MAG: DNA repair protein RecN [Clostridia bacterium]|nr:DNA repair protein RecN [Clostridia bacterium]